MLTAQGPGDSVSVSNLGRAIASEFDVNTCHVMCVRLVSGAHLSPAKAND